MKELRTEEVLGLRRQLVRVSGPERTALLNAALGRPIRSPKALREWHDLLLFLLAHPANDRELASVGTELDRVARIVGEKVRRSDRLRAALIDSGMAGAPLQTTCTLHLVRWMLDRWHNRVELSSVEAPLEEFTELLRMLLPKVELETVDQPAADAHELLDRSFGPSRAEQLRFLVRGLEMLPTDERVREHLWSRLQLYVRIEGSVGCAMTHARAPSAAPYFLSEGLVRKVDLMGLVNEPVAAPVRLGDRQQREVIDTARMVLVALHRETDPVTFAGAVELFDMGRGLRIALFHLDAAHRLPFDSYVGFMAFRNGIPLAYGGAWIFPGRSKIGINVFPALRGGESAWFFAQLLRLYRQRFDVDRFEAENYQLGHDNPDGLRSGAYWFYYRIGFRPFTPAMRRTAAREYERLGARTNYQVPVGSLKRMVEEGSELEIAACDIPIVDTAALTMAVQRHIVERYGGDRRAALGSAMARMRVALDIRNIRSWSSSELHALELWALPLDMIGDLEQWPPIERVRLRAMVRSKGERTETRHQRLLAAHRRLLTALKETL